MSFSIRDETLIEKDIAAIFANFFCLERANQLSRLPDKDLVDLCPLSESYQVTKSRKYGSSRFCVISVTYYKRDQSLCPLCPCGSFHSLASGTVS
jgi:hypothetical protein